MTRAAELLKVWGPVALPGLAGASLLALGYGPRWAWLVLAHATLAGGALLAAQRRTLEMRLGAVSSVLAAYRDGDFSVRAAEARAAPFSGVLAEVNRLGDELRDQRLGAIEAWSLLHKVLAEIDVVVLAFDGQGRLRLANEAAAKLLGKPSAALRDEDATTLGLAELFAADAPPDSEGRAGPSTPHPPAPRIVKDSPTLGPGPWRCGAERSASKGYRTRCSSSPT